MNALAIQKQPWFLLGWISTICLSCNLEQINKAPVFEDQVFQVAAPIIENTIIGEVIATDPNEDQELTFNLLDSSPSSGFSIMSNSGLIRYEPNPDSEPITAPTINLRVKATDNGTPPLEATATVGINLLNTDDFSRTIEACYSFSGNLKDESFNGHDATAFGGQFTQDRHGQQNSAYRLNGESDYLELPSTLRFKPNTSRSLSFWIKTTQTSRFDLFDQRTGSFAPDLYNFGITFNHQDPTIGGLLYCFPLYNSTFEHTRLISADQNSFNDNKWHHFVFVKDLALNKMLVYMDGSLWLTKNIVDTDFSINGALMIGKNYLDIYYYSGSIDDIKIYNAAISEEEVGELFYDNP